MVQILKKISVVAIAVIAAIATSFIAGCQKEEYEASTPYCDFENPYEYVGKYHNEALAYILPKMSDSIRLKSSGANIENNAYDLTREFCKNNPLKDGIFSEEYFELIVQASPKNRLKSKDNSYSYAIQQYNKKFKDLLNNPQNCKSISDMLNAIKTIEKEISESNIDDVDKEILLVSYAVGRNSLEFWLACTNINQVQPRLKSGSELINSFLSWWNSVEPTVSFIVGEDANGAIDGMILGGTAGAVFGTYAGGPVAGAALAIRSAVQSGAWTGVYASVKAGVLYYRSN